MVRSSCVHTFTENQPDTDEAAGSTKQAAVRNRPLPANPVHQVDPEQIRWYFADAVKEGCDVDVAWQAAGV